MSIFESTSECPACIEKVLGSVSSLPASSFEAECAFSVAGLFLTKMCSSLSAFFTNTLQYEKKSVSVSLAFLTFNLVGSSTCGALGPVRGAGPPWALSLFMKLISHLYLSTVCLINQSIFLSLFPISFPCFSSFSLFFHLNFVLFLVTLGSIFQVLAPLGVGP